MVPSWTYWYAKYGETKLVSYVIWRNYFLVNIHVITVIIYFDSLRKLFKNYWLTNQLKKSWSVCRARVYPCHLTMKFMSERGGWWKYPMKTRSCITWLWSSWVSEVDGESIRWRPAPVLAVCRSPGCTATPHHTLGIEHCTNSTVVPVIRIIKKNHFILV